MYCKYFKRLIDIVFALIVLLMVLPILILVIVLIKLDSRGPILFKQDRLGRRNRIFQIYKFRTMSDKKRTPDREILPGDHEVTPVGYYLRRFKIDELPQLVNILKGDMSLIGPRPCLPSHLEEMSNYEGLRSSVRPGLTGLAQVNGNIYLSWEDRWKLDVTYVDKLSFLLDIKIFIKTIGVVIFGENQFVKK